MAGRWRRTGTPFATPRFAGLDVVHDAAADLERARGVSSSPAIIRRSVDLPQPMGPTKTTNSPSSIVDVAPLLTSTLRKGVGRPS